MNTNTEESSHPGITSYIPHKETFSSSLKDKAVSNIFNLLTQSEVLDPLVEGFVKESTESLIESILENSCILAKHKGDETINQDHIYLSLYKLANIVEPNNSNSALYHNLKINEMNRNITQDHKKRMEISKEENKTSNE
mmetsp:Transcript_11021/g.11403  ORF Transcript_11021/g.11403 Transcript_11021/m.11403 type:complete len:139 (-) Transcript_11021:78-494(-)